MYEMKYFLTKTKLSRAGGNNNNNDSLQLFIILSGYRYSTIAHWCR
jgi:hypothetical protein